MARGDFYAAHRDVCFPCVLDPFSARDYCAVDYYHPHPTVFTMDADGTLHRAPLRGTDVGMDTSLEDGRLAFWQAKNRRYADPTYHGGTRSYDLAPGRYNRSDIEDWVMRVADHSAKRAQFYAVESHYIECARAFHAAEDLARAAAELQAHNAVTLGVFAGASLAAFVAALYYGGP